MLDEHLWLPWRWGSTQQFLKIDVNEVAEMWIVGPSSGEVIIEVGNSRINILEHFLHFIFSQLSFNHFCFTLTF